MYDIIKLFVKWIGGSDLYVLYLVNEMGSLDFGRKREMDGIVWYFLGVIGVGVRGVRFVFCEG